MKTHSSRSMVLSLSLVAAACSGTRATPPAAPVATVSASADASVTASADAAATPATDPRRDAVLAAWNAAAPPGDGTAEILAGPIDYPDPEAQGLRVAAVVGRGEDAQLLVTPVPFVAGAAMSASLSLSSTAAEAIAGLSARDLNGDHRDDLAVFLRREYELENYISLQRFALLYTPVTSPERELKPLIRAENELLGVRDDAALAAALPNLHTYEPPSEGMSPARFIARLRYATPAQFRAAVAATGLRLCTDLPDRTGNRRKRCTTYPAARLTDALITGRIRHDLGVFVEVLVDDTSDLQSPSCQRAGREIQCSASVGGPAGVGWSVIGEGAAMRILEISPWAESS
jgi:hypothetical protein